MGNETLTPAKVMIGDWVEYNGEYYKVNAMNSLNMWISAKDIKIVRECHPIEITPELLEKNGWKHSEEKEQDANDYSIGGYYTYYDCWKKRYGKEYEYIEIKKEVGEKSYIYEEGITIKYLHELQHLLRINKMYEIADSFEL